MADEAADEVAVEARPLGRLARVAGRPDRFGHLHVVDSGQRMNRS